MPRRRDWAASCTAAPALRGEPHRRSLRVPSRSDACGLLPFREFHALGPRPTLPDDPCCNSRAFGRRNHRLGVVPGGDRDHPDAQVEYAAHLPERHFARAHQHPKHRRPRPPPRIDYGLTSRRQHAHQVAGDATARDVRERVQARDRKSTRLNSSHGYISYAVFCLKKKTDRRSTRLNSSHGYISYAVFCLKKKIPLNRRMMTSIGCMAIYRSDTLLVRLYVCRGAIPATLSAL